MIPKFRAWHKKEKKMYKVDAVHFDDAGKKVETARLIEPYGRTIYQIEQVILMQSTSLKDKNGKEIFEGDIIKSDADYKTLFIIEWCNDRNMMAGFCGKNIHAEGKPKTDYYLHKGSHIEIHYLSPMKIIGNIYENLELLAEVKK